MQVPLNSDKLSMVLFMADNTPSLRRFHKHLSLEQYDRVLDKLEATGERISVRGNRARVHFAATLSVCSQQCELVVSVRSDKEHACTWRQY